MEKIFTIVGFGEVGSLVAALINSSFSGITINVINTQLGKSGRILDLEHAAASKNNLITHNDHHVIGLSEIIVYAAGYSNVHGESRNTVAQKNKELAISFFDEITFQVRSTIVVITNPVEPISFWIKEKVGEKCQVIGTGTSLDTFRLTHILSKKFNCRPKDIETLVIGEHGINMVPVFSQTFVKGTALSELCNSAELDLIAEELVQCAFQIRETEKATKYGIAETCLFLIHALISHQDTIIPISTDSISLWKEAHFSKPIFISLPTRISSSGIKSTWIELSSKEKEKLQLAINSISSTLNCQAD